jgi:hypothetical protein
MTEPQSKDLGGASERCAQARLGFIAKVRFVHVEEQSIAAALKSKSSALAPTSRIKESGPSTAARRTSPDKGSVFLASAQDDGFLFIRFGERSPR